MSDEIKTIELEAANEIFEKLKEVHAETNEGLCIECGDHYPCPTRYIIGRPYDEGTAHVRFQPRRDMAEAIQRVRELHTWRITTSELDPNHKKICLACSQWHDCENWTQTTGKSVLVQVEYPCPTIKALDGEQG